MEKIHFTKYINAPVSKVWEVMLDKNTYPQWTKDFSPDGFSGSNFEGSWDEGSEIKFLSTDDKGVTGGMYARIKENRPHQFISIEHLGIIADGQIDTTSEEVKKWTPAFENYTFKEKDGGTELFVDMDIAPEYKEMFETIWPKALDTLKELAEK